MNNQKEEYEVLNATELFEKGPILLYPREVEAELGPYALIALAAQLVGREPRYKNVFQFLFVVQGGASTKYLKIGDHNATVNELAGDIRKSSALQRMKNRQN